MSTEQTWQTESISSDATLALGEQIGRNLRGGEIIELIGDLGSGKTTFVKGLAKGAGSSDRVHSPSFNIENIYDAGKLMLHHFDLYRLQDPGLIRDQLQEVVNQPDAVSLLEWPAVVPVDDLFNEKITIHFRVIDEQKRGLLFTYSQRLGYCLNSLA